MTITCEEVRGLVTSKHGGQCQHDDDVLGQYGGGMLVVIGGEKCSGQRHNSVKLESVGQ